MSDAKRKRLAKKPNSKDDLASHISYELYYHSQLLNNYETFHIKSRSVITVHNFKECKIKFLLNFQLF